MIRILLVDDHALFRGGLVRLLGAEPDFEVVGDCASVEEAVEILARRPVDVLLLDVDLGASRGGEILARMRRSGLKSRVLVVTAGLNDAEAAQLVREGAAGVFFKHGSPAALATSIRRVMEGEASIDQRLLSSLVGLGAPRERPEARPALTDREREVLRGVFEGQANKEIASQLGISESSVKAALQQLFHKAGVRTRSQLVRIALEQYRDEI